MRAKLLTVCVSLLCGLGCPSEQPAAQDAAPPKPDLRPQLAIRDGLLYSFYNNRAEMRTVERPKDVAETARQYVMVTDPSKRLSQDLVFVADLRAKQADGRYRVWVEPKSRWLDRVVPKQSVLKKLALAEARRKDRAQARARRRRARRHRRHRPRAGKPKQAAVRVLLFSTSWCPSCRAAKAFFKSKGIRFQELDVERDPKAQQTYMALAQQYRLKRGVVPVIVVGNRIFQGFSKPQIEAALVAMAKGQGGGPPGGGPPGGARQGG